MLGRMNDSLAKLKFCNYVRYVGMKSSEIATCEPVTTLTNQINRGMHPAKPGKSTGFKLLIENV